MELSVLLSGIRPGNWLTLYNSIKESSSGKFELVIVSPFQPPWCLYDLKDVDNITFVQDWGAPVRCYQIALVNAKGKYIVQAADDGIFCPDALNKAVNALNLNDNSVVVGKYNEGAENPIMNQIDYYYPARHKDTAMPYVPKDCLMLMEGVVPREIMIEVGGWDTRFQTAPMAFIDLSIRLYNKGCKFIFQEEMLFRCSHMPGTEGDHKPVHIGQTQRDVPLFQLIYSQAKSKDRIKIDLDNWKDSPSKWNLRFGV